MVAHRFRYFNRTIPKATANIKYASAFRVPVSFEGFFTDGRVTLDEQIFEARKFLEQYGVPSFYDDIVAHR